MKQYWMILVGLIWLGQTQAQKTFGTYDLMDLQFVGETAVSADEKFIAYTVSKRRPLKEGAGSNYTELYVYDVKAKKSQVYIPGENSFSSIQWRPESTEITFLASFNGSRQLYGIDLNGGSYYQISEAKPSISSYDWHPSGKSIAYIATERAPSSNDLKKLGFNAEVFEEDLAKKNLYTYDISTKKSKQLISDVAVHTVAWNPAGTAIACMISPENLVDQYYMDKKVYTVDPSSGERKKVFDNPGKMTDLAWSPDGKHIAVVCGADKNDPVSGSVFVQNIAAPKPFEDLKNFVQDLPLSATHVKWKNNTTILYSSDQSVETTLSEHAISGGERKVILEAGKVILGAFSISGNTVSFAGNTPTHPNELYSFSVKKGTLTKLTNVNAHLKGFALAKQERVTYKSRDGKKIEGVLMYPLKYDGKGKYPLICYIHGGPESCVKNGWTTYYSMWGQTAAAKGYFVFMPNYRGSSGRGIAYSKADYGDLADEEFNDVLDGIDYLVANKGVDNNRVGIGGGSYGGYFSAWGATKHSDRFKAACAFVGVSNQISKRNTTDIPKEDYLVHWGIWTNENVELIYDRSPVKYASNNKTATLILHGKEDPRVHPSQSLELYRQLKMHGSGAVRLVWYPGEGHGNRQNPARIDYSLRTMQWFDYYLLEGNKTTTKPDKDLEIKID